MRVHWASRTLHGNCLWDKFHQAAHGQRAGCHTVCQERDWIVLMCSQATILIPVSCACDTLAKLFCACFVGLWSLDKL
jgi:hypothetical protein